MSQYEDFKLPKNFVREFVDLYVRPQGRFASRAEFIKNVIEVYNLLHREPFQYKKIEVTPIPFEDQYWVWPTIILRESTQYGWVVFGKEFTLGFKTDIGCNTVILAHCGVRIEPYAQIGPNCSIISKSTIDGKEGPVIIKEHACIGANSVIMPGVTIGAYSIIGAGSFVNKDIPSYTKFIQKREIK